MGKQVFICIGAFLLGSYMQKKFDVCGKLENFWEKAQESFKSKPEQVDNEE
jgi:hypothetical protein